MSVPLPPATARYHLIGWMLVVFVILVIAVRVVFIFWPRGKTYAQIAYACCALLVVVMALIGVVQGYRRRLLALRSATPAEALNAPPPEPAPDPHPLQQARAAEPSALEPLPTADPSVAQPDQEQFRTFASKGCRLSAPATWTVQAQSADSAARLVISDSIGESSVGIHHEAASGTMLTERDVAQIMERANRMPLKLIDGSWSLLDNRKAWRELRVGPLRGSNHVWIRYSYQVGSAVVQVIGVAAENLPRQGRELIETIMRSAHCEP